MRHATDVVFHLSDYSALMACPTLALTRLELARHHYRECGLCEHRCGADREAGERGPCKAGTQARVYKQRVEYGEEWELVPSHLFYLSGCDLKCAFCVAGVNAFDPRRGQPLTAEFLAASGRKREA